MLLLLSLWVTSTDNRPGLVVIEVLLLSLWVTSTDNRPGRYRSVIIIVVGDFH